MTLKIRVNRKSVESMTRQIANQLTNLISTGAVAVGSLLPSERTLAESLGVARNVVRGSYDYLEEAGLVQREGRDGRRIRSKSSRKKAAPKPTKRASKKRARSRGLLSIEQFLEPQTAKGTDLEQRRQSVKVIDELRERLFAKYGVMPDSTALIREDRAR